MKVGQKQVFQQSSTEGPVALMGSIQVQFVTNGLAASVNLCFLCFVGKFRNTVSRDARQNTAGLQIIAEEVAKARARWSKCAPLQNSGVCAEVLAQGDHVALGISNHRFSVEPWHCLDRGGFKPSFPKLSNMVLQVVHEEREQSLAGAIGVTDHVDPSGICSLPHGFVFRHDDIWGPSEEALVPRERRVVVGHGNASEDMLDGQCSLLISF